MSYAVFATIIYAVYALLFLAGALLIAFGLLARRNGRFGWGRIITGAVLFLLPVAVIASSAISRS